MIHFSHLCKCYHSLFIFHGLYFLYHGLHFFSYALHPLPALFHLTRFLFLFSITVSILCPLHSIILAFYFLARDIQSIFFLWQKLTIKMYNWSNLSLMASIFFLTVFIFSLMVSTLFSLHSIILAFYFVAKDA